MPVDSSAAVPGAQEAAIAAAARPRALIGWRMLSLSYDLFPVAALWFAVAAVFVGLHGDSVRGGWLGLLEFACLWLVTGAYATLSWRRGGQTLGMRPWRLRVVPAAEGPASWRALWLRYLVGQVSLLALGLGFWWAWFDRGRLTWHDRVSGTRVLRSEKR